MNNALKGALLSGLIMPGLGQMVLKHYARGVLFMLAVLASVSMAALKAARCALLILERMDLADGEIDLNAITNAATQAVSRSDSLEFNLLMLLAIVLWIVGIVDAYRIGSKMDAKEQSSRMLSKEE